MAASAVSPSQSRVLPDLHFYRLALRFRYLLTGPGSSDKITDQEDAEIDLLFDILLFDCEEMLPETAEERAQVAKCLEPYITAFEASHPEAPNLVKAVEEFERWAGETDSTINPLPSEVSPDQLAPFYYPIPEGITTWEALAAYFKADWSSFWIHLEEPDIFGAELSKALFGRHHKLVRSYLKKVDYAEGAMIGLIRYLARLGHRNLIEKVSMYIYMHTARKNLYCSDTFSEDQWRDVHGASPYEEAQGEGLAYVGRTQDLHDFVGRFPVCPWGGDSALPSRCIIDGATAGGQDFILQGKLKK